MATLLLSALGTAVGGPVGGALGALLGRQVDQTVIGQRRVDGPRLSELVVSTSSYGQPIPRVFGQMRVAGVIIWSTNLEETSQSEGGGKGRPKTTSYSYSVSLAVAVSSTPIREIGRIWADGKLLRGAAQDLKVPGQIRVHRGLGDEAPDHLIAAAMQQEATGFRDLAYVVLEDLDLTEFGNRIPALSFEVFGDDTRPVSLGQWVPGAAATGEDDRLKGVLGLADVGGDLAGSLAGIGIVYPIVCRANSRGVTLANGSSRLSSVATLPPKLVTAETSPAAHRIESKRNANPRLALRYYDRSREYQPGLQRDTGQSGPGYERIVDLPAAMESGGAKDVIAAQRQSARWRKEQLVWPVAMINSTHFPGQRVTPPGVRGIWTVQSWQWSNEGIELVLLRESPAIRSSASAAPMFRNPAPDLVSGPTELAVFEVPAVSGSTTNRRMVYAAASSVNSAWKGAMLHRVENDRLTEILATGRRRAIMGRLDEALAPSRGLLLESSATAVVELVADDQILSGASLEALSRGHNRLLVGSEVLQFQQAKRLDARRWKLEGLLRGRGGTESSAMSGHQPGTQIVYLDDRLIELPESNPGAGFHTEFAAIGLGDSVPAFAEQMNPGLSLRPPSPVHPRSVVRDDGGLMLAWTRRARGHWVWAEGVETPLVEERELYRVAYGPTPNPFMTWETSRPMLSIPANELTRLEASHRRSGFTVRQVGTYGISPPLALGLWA